MKSEKTLYFSIIVPTYNRAEIIGETIQSVLNQRYSDFELLIVDDGGTDETEKVVTAFADERITYYKKENAERGAARNYGAKRAKGKFVYFLDSDDLLYTNHLEIAHQFIFKKCPRIFFQQYELTLENGEKRKPYHPKNGIINAELIIKGNFMSCHGVFIERKVFLTNLFNEDRELAGSEDYELWLRLAARFPIYYSSTITSTLVYHSKRSVLNMNAKSLIIRKEKMLRYIFEDQKFIKKYSHFKKQMVAEAYSYLALHLVLAGDKRQAFYYLKKSMGLNPMISSQKRFFVTLLKLIT